MKSLPSDRIFLNATRQVVRLVGLSLIPVFLAQVVFSQTFSTKYTYEKSRILFVLDASGSMNEILDGKTRMERAKETLLHLVDSISGANPRVEFGLRVFGHQSHKDLKNCKDSELEIPFKAGNNQAFRQKLARIQPMGWTPITYSLYMAANDFPDDRKSENHIILITDGLENCGGDPCEAGRMLLEKRVAVKPFIIGLGMDKKSAAYFDCVGNYFSVQSGPELNQTATTVARLALNQTTAQINLLDAGGQPLETDVEVTLTDAFSGKLVYAFVHTLLPGNQPDTLFLDPKGVYNLTVHTFPPVSKKNIELYPGKHNIISANVPRGVLQLRIRGDERSTSNLLCVVKRPGGREIVHVQELNTDQKYLIGEYDLEILTLPPIIHKGVVLGPGNPTEIFVERSGHLNFQGGIGGTVGIFHSVNGKPELVAEAINLKERDKFTLLPGQYKIYYRPPGKDRHSSKTSVHKVTISPGQSHFIRLP